MSETNNRRYASIESSVLRTNTSADIEAAQAHLIVIRFTAPDPGHRWDEVMPLDPNDPNAWITYPTKLAPVPVRVKNALARLGFEVEVEVEPPSRIMARRPTTWRSTRGR